MFKDVSIWCLILGIVILMFVHHILSDKPLFEGNENIDEEETTEATEGDSTAEAEGTAAEPTAAEPTVAEPAEPAEQEDYMDLSQPESVNLTIRTDTAAELQSILLQQPIETEPTTEVEEPVPAEEETEVVQEPFM